MKYSRLVQLNSLLAMVTMIDEEVSIFTTRAEPGKRVLRKVGSASHRGARSNLPTGPESAQDLFDWPSWTTKRIAEDPARAKRLVDFLSCGTRLSTDYSGMDCLVEVFIQFEQAMHRVLDREPGQAGRHFRYTRSCDKERLLQTVLADLQQRRGYGCIFTDIVDRLPAHLHAKVISMQP